MRPKREHATNNHQTYMVTSSTWGRRSIFQVDRWAELFVKTLYNYRGDAYLLHEFVLMADHFHLLITPKITLERAVQYIKGGFSFRAKKELGSGMEVWQKGFQDHRIRDVEDYSIHVEYIHQNPVRKKLCDIASEYPWSSTHSGFELDPVPQGLKPLDEGSSGIGAAKAAPFQNGVDGDEAAPFQNGFGADETARCQHRLDDRHRATIVAPFQDRFNDQIGAAKATPFQSIEIKEPRTR
jgi:putative transposase